MLSDDLIYLRKLEATDLDRTWVWINDPEVYLKIGSQIPVSKSAQLRWFEQTDRASDKIIFAICMNEEDTHVGNVSLDNIEARHRTARLSIFIGNTASRGSSIGSRALNILLDYCFNFLNLNKVWCKTDAGNLRIHKFYGRLGFKAEGVLRQHEFQDGAYVDKLIFGFLKQEHKI